METDIYKYDPNLYEVDEMGYFYFPINIVRKGENKWK